MIFGTTLVLPYMVVSSKYIIYVLTVYVVMQSNYWDYRAPTVESLIRKEVEGCCRSVISHNVAEFGETEDNHEKIQPEESVLGGRNFIQHTPNASQIRRKNAKFLYAMFVATH